MKLSTEVDEPVEDRMAAFKDFLLGKFDGAAVLEEFNERALFKIPLVTLSKLSVAFASLETG